MHQRVIAVRKVLSVHRWTMSLMHSWTTPGRATLRHHDAVFGYPRRAGFTVELAGHAFSILDTNICGFALREGSLPVDTGQDTTVLAQTILAQFPVDEYPNFAEFIFERAAPPGYNYGDKLDFGFKLRLKGLESVRPAPAQ